MEILGKEDKKQNEHCTFLLQCCGPLRAGKRGLQTLPLFCFWWLTIDYFFLPHFIYMIQHFRSRRAMTGQGMSSFMERWGVKLFFAKQLFADLWITICFCFFYFWTYGEPGASLSASDFFNEVYKSWFMHEYIYYCKPFTRVCTAYLSNRVWNVLKWSWALCCHYPKGSVPVFPYQSVKQSAWALGSPKQTHLICSWY